MWRLILSEILRRNGQVRELLLGGGVLLTGALDRCRRPVLTIFAREVIGIAAAATGRRGGGSSGSSSTQPSDVVLACHWLLECVVHTWPECQRRGVGVSLLVDGTGVEDVDAGHCAALSTLVGQVIIAGLRHHVPVAVALLLGLNCGGCLQPLWRECAQQVTSAGGVAEMFAPRSSAESLAVLRPHLASESLLPDHGGTLEWSHKGWCERVDATMCDEDWPWPTAQLEVPVEVPVLAAPGQ
jgi:hypothetical protein